MAVFAVFYECFGCMCLNKWWMHWIRTKTCLKKENTPIMMTTMLRPGGREQNAWCTFKIVKRSCDGVLPKAWQKRSALSDVMCVYLHHLLMEEYMIHNASGGHTGRAGQPFIGEPFNLISVLWIKKKKRCTSNSVADDSKFLCVKQAHRS